MPVRRRAREPRDLQRQHDPDMTETDLRDELFDAQPPVSARARPAGVFVDDADRSGRPAQLDGAVAQRVLARRRLRVALNLMQRRLTDIDDRASTPLQLGDL